MARAVPGLWDHNFRVGLLKPMSDSKSDAMSMTFVLTHVCKSSKRKLQILSIHKLSISRGVIEHVIDTNQECQPMPPFHQSTTCASIASQSSYSRSESPSSAASLTYTSEPSQSTSVNK